MAAFAQVRAGHGHQGVWNRTHQDFGVQLHICVLPVDADPSLCRRCTGQQRCEEQKRSKHGDNADLLRTAPQAPQALMETAAEVRELGERCSALN